MSKPTTKKNAKPMKKAPINPDKKSFVEVIGTELGYIKRGEKHLNADFMGGILLMLITILLILGLAIFTAVKDIENGFEERNFSMLKTLANNIYSKIDSSYDENNLEPLQNVVDGFRNNKAVAYLLVLDEDGNVLGSTFALPNPEIDVVTNRVATQFLSQVGITDTIDFDGKKCGAVTVFVGFNNDKMFSDKISELAKSFIGVFILCLLLGVWLAAGIGRRVMKPVKGLVKATGKFAEGDLSDRLEKCKYVEFNELVDSYNGMADSIQKLYSTLEHQVQERTRQLNDAIKELQDTQAMMVHSEKMKSLGELVAGIMHEINNPINFIYGNMSHLKNYSEDLFDLIDDFDKFKDDLTPEHRTEYEKMLKDIDYEFLKEDLPDLIKSCHEGTERTKNIILNLKDFSRMEESAITNVDLPKEIDSTLNILNNKFKHGITVKKDYHDDVPKIEAYGGQLNQVFMNILDNAAFAVEGKENAEVDITIRKDAKFAYIEIQDNGKGMDEETKDKIFNPFFTTKPVGQGTGLGLSISYKVIKNHNGTIDVQSEVGKGTKFTIKIPLLFEARQTVAEEKKNDIEVI